METDGQRPEHRAPRDSVGLNCKGPVPAEGLRQHTASAPGPQGLQQQAGVRGHGSTHCPAASKGT